MANLGLTFDANDVEPDDHEPADFSKPIPNGTTVQLQCIEAEIIQTKAGTGMKLTHEVIEGEHSKRRIWDFINLDNPSEECMRIGRRQLANLCLAMGRPRIEDTDELLYQPFSAKVGIKAGDKIPGTNDRYPAKNTIKSYVLDGAEPAQQQPARQSAPAQRQATPAQQAGKRPWPSRAA